MAKQKAEEIVVEHGSKDTDEVFILKRSTYLNLIAPEDGPPEPVEKGSLIRLKPSTAGMLQAGGRVEPQEPPTQFECLHPFTVRGEDGRWQSAGVGDVVELADWPQAQRLMEGRLIKPIKEEIDNDNANVEG